MLRATRVEEALPQALGASVCRSPCANLVPRARRDYAPRCDDPLLAKAYNTTANPARGHDGGDGHMAGTPAELRQCACMRRAADGCMHRGGLHRQRVAPSRLRTWPPSVGREWRFGMKCRHGKGPRVCALDHCSRTCDQPRRATRAAGPRSLRMPIALRQPRTSRPTRLRAPPRGPAACQGVHSRGQACSWARWRRRPHGRHAGRATAVRMHAVHRREHAWTRASPARCSKPAPDRASTRWSRWHLADKWRHAKDPRERAFGDG